MSDGERTTSLFCDASGGTVARRTTDEASQAVEAVIEVAGIGELRPHEGVFLMRVPLAKTTTAEEAYSLTTGELDVARSAYVISDVRGSTLSRLEYAAPGRATTSETEYDAWGKDLPISPKPRPTHAYTSREPDPGTGFYHYGPRSYDPSLRRWLSPDPLIALAPDRQAAWGEQLNLYSYASNNPARWTDLSGLEGPSAMESLRSLGHFAGAALVGFIHGASPVPTPDPPIAHERGTAHEKEHVVGFAVGQVAGGYVVAQTGSGIAGGGGVGEVLSGGTATMAAVPAMAVGATMVVSGSISISKGLTTLYNEARNHGAGGGQASPGSEAAPPAAAPAPAASSGGAPPASAQVKANQAAGKAYESAVQAQLEAEGWEVGREVTVQTPSGARTRLDIVATKGDAVRCVECKSSTTAPLTTNQRAAFPEIATGGATVQGAGKSNVPGGTTIPPTQVEVVRPK